MEGKETVIISSRSESESQTSEVEAATNTRRTRSILFYVYLTGRVILIGIWIYFLLHVVFYGLTNFHQWMGFTAIHMTLECSITYSDPMWDFLPDSRTLLHSILAGLAVVAGISSVFPGVALVEFRENNSRWGHLFITVAEAGIFILVIATGLCLFMETSRTIWFYRCHKYLGTLATYFMIAVLASGIFQWLTFPGNWTVLGLTIAAFVLMPIGLLHIIPTRAVTISTR